MRHAILLATVVATLAAGACAPVPPERTARDATIMRAIEPCRRLFPRVPVLGVDETGAVQVLVWSRADQSDAEGLQRCVREQLADAPEVRAFQAGTIAPTSGPSTVPLRSAGATLLVGVSINGSQATLILDTGAALTLISPRLAERAGVALLTGGSKMLATVVGGRRVEIPLARARSLGVGAAVVENLQVGVYDALPGRDGIDGLLGANFLDHFKVTIDRQNRRLSLETARPVAAGVAATREWRPPALVAGDRWHLRWQGPGGSGTIGLTVEGEEVVDGVPHYVMRAGTVRLYYVKATLGLHFQKDGEALITRRTPPAANDWPLRVGKQWEVTFRNENLREGRTVNIYRKCVVAGSPTITVPAGTFETVHVVCYDRAGRVVYESWYSDLAKSAVQQREMTTQGFIITELAAYVVRRAP